MTVDSANILNRQLKVCARARRNVVVPPQEAWPRKLAVTRRARSLRYRSAFIYCRSLRHMPQLKIDVSSDNYFKRGKILGFGNFLFTPVIYMYKLVFTNFVCAQLPQYSTQLPQYLLFKKVRA